MIEEVKKEDGTLDFKRMAARYQKEHKCRWSEACLEIKQRYPESRAFFGAPTLEECGKKD